MFQGQYEELFAAVDEVAERIRALGEKAPGSFAAFCQERGRERKKPDLPPRPKC
jgi:starvation-inducible DNA-binding protein